LGTAPFIYYHPELNRLFVSQSVNPSLYSDDDGITWHDLLPTPLSPLGGMVFIDAFRGFVGTGSSALSVHQLQVTIDGGKTWDSIQNFYDNRTKFVGNPTRLKDQIFFSSVSSGPQPTDVGTEIYTIDKWNAQPKLLYSSSFLTTGV
jgi:photosystem II stability/assembly factor-like uncharacterized protein